MSTNNELKILIALDIIDKNNKLTKKGKLFMRDLVRFPLETAMQFLEEIIKLAKENQK